MITVVFVGGLCTAWAAFFGDNRWCVWNNQRVWVPPSAQDVRCSGHTFAWFDTDSDSSATFTLSPRDVPGFLSQFKVAIEYHPIWTGPAKRHRRPAATSRPWPGPISPAGYAMFGSPTGQDWVTVEWQAEDQRVRVNLLTHWD
jgi:hypothetical protein